MDASDWDDRYRSADRLWSVEPNLFVADRLGPSTPGIGIDLAGGEGRNAVWLASRGWEMTSVDFSEVAAEKGRARNPSVHFVVADVREWEPEREVDLVLIAYLHIDPAEFDSVLRRSAGWLGPGGEAFLIGHDLSNLERGHGGPQVPEILWDVDAIVSQLDGLVIVESQVVRRPVDVAGETVFALDTLVRARKPR